MNQKTKSNFEINIILAILVTFFSSYFVNLILVDMLNYTNETAHIVKTTLLVTILLMTFIPVFQSKFIRKYTIVMIFIVIANLANSYVNNSLWFNKLFDTNTFIGSVGSNVSTKFVISILVLGILLIIYKKIDNIYLRYGNLSVYASEIKFLGIKNNEIRWGRLSIISAVLIALGTVLLTLTTVIGSINNFNFDLWYRMLPFIIVFASANAFAEGMLFRNAVIAPLSNHLPKGLLIALSAILFGSYHYHGVPSGVVGIIMSSILGWFIARSVYETKGFFAGWLIHFAQDIVIFSTIVLLG